MHNEDDPRWGNMAAAAIRGIWGAAAELRRDRNSRIYKIPLDLATVPILPLDEHIEGATGWRETDTGLAPVCFYAGYGWLSENEACNKDLEWVSAATS